MEENFDPKTIKFEDYLHVEGVKAINPALPAFKTDVTRAKNVKLIMAYMEKEKERQKAMEEYNKAMEVRMAEEAKLEEQVASLPGWKRPIILTKLKAKLDETHPMPVKPADSVEQSKESPATTPDEKQSGGDLEAADKPKPIPAWKQKQLEREAAAASQNCTPPANRPNLSESRNLNGSGTSTPAEERSTAMALPTADEATTTETAPAPDKSASTETPPSVDQSTPTEQVGETTSSEVEPCAEVEVPPVETPATTESSSVVEASSEKETSHASEAAQSVEEPATEKNKLVSDTPSEPTQSTECAAPVQDASDQSPSNVDEGPEQNLTPKTEPTKSEEVVEKVEDAAQQDSSNADKEAVAEDSANQAIKPDTGDDDSQLPEEQTDDMSNAEQSPETTVAAENVITETPHDSKADECVEAPCDAIESNKVADEVDAKCAAEDPEVTTAKEPESSEPSTENLPQSTQEVLQDGHVDVSAAAPVAEDQPAAKATDRPLQISLPQVEQATTSNDLPAAEESPLSSDPTPSDNKQSEEQTDTAESLTNDVGTQVSLCDCCLKRNESEGTENTDAVDHQAPSLPNIEEQDKKITTADCQTPPPSPAPIEAPAENVQDEAASIVQPTPENAPDKPSEPVLDTNMQAVESDSKSEATVEPLHEEDKTATTPESCKPEETSVHEVSFLSGESSTTESTDTVKSTESCSTVAIPQSKQVVLAEGSKESS